LFIQKIAPRHITMNAPLFIRRNQNLTVATFD
jgi:hypothetical protein